MKLLRLIVLLACLPVVGTIVAASPSGDQAVSGATPMAEANRMPLDVEYPIRTSCCQWLQSPGNHRWLRNATQLRAYRDMSSDLVNGEGD